MHPPMLDVIHRPIVVLLVAVVHVVAVVRWTAALIARVAERFDVVGEVAAGGLLAWELLSEMLAYYHATI